ncbi:hypothetical protein [Paenibacillus sp. sptzw28]|nr:hypothetical protein [Paenibacillus sp. sptzw28]
MPLHVNAGVIYPLTDGRDMLIIGQAIRRYEGGIITITECGQA